MKGRIFGLAAAVIAFNTVGATVLNGTGFDINPTFNLGFLDGQNSWITFGDYNVTAAAAQANTQSVTVDSSQISQSWGWVPLASGPNYLNSGVILTSVWVRYDDVTPTVLTDNSAVGLDAWSSAGVEHFATLMIHPSRGGVLKAGFDDTAVSNSNVTLARNTWTEMILACEPATRKCRGYVNGVDIGGILVNSSTTASNISDVDLACYAFGPYPELFGVSPDGGFNNVFWDSYRVDQVNQGTVRGKVILQDYSAALTNHGVTVQLLNSAGAILETRTSVMDSAGVFFVTFVSRGTNLSVNVKADHWLARQVPIGDLENIGAFNANVSLINGDIDGNNEVGLSDYGILSTAYGTSAGDSGFAPNADLDGNTEVGLSDYGILSSNYGQSGD